jgi:transcriptional coactivator HFI1/ADA1
MPDQGVAPWVSANDKPTTNVGTKPVTGDAAERRLKGEVMQLPSRDRRRIKESAQSQVDVSISLVAPRSSTYSVLANTLVKFDPFEPMTNMFMEHHRGKPTRAPDIPQSANGLNKMSKFSLSLSLSLPPAGNHFEHWC